MSEWQPIETAPLDGESVLLHYGIDYYVMEGRCFKREREREGTENTCITIGWLP